MKEKILLLILLVGILIGLAPLVGDTVSLRRNTNYFNSIFQQCSEQKNNKTCYYNQALLLETKDPNQVKRLLAYFARKAQKGIFPTLFHDLTHDLGMNLYYKLRDPIKAFSYCSDEFQNGCYHGVVMAYFDETTTEKTFSFANGFSFCKSLEKKLSLSQDVYDQCVHGIGHIGIAKLQGNLSKALEGCDKEGTQKAQCYSGVFMEYSKGETQTSHHSHNREGTIAIPCSSLPTQYKISCYRLSGRGNPAFLVKSDAYGEALDNCQDDKNAYSYICMIGIAEKMLIKTDYDIYKAKIECIKMQDNTEACKDALIFSKVALIDDSNNASTCKFYTTPATRQVCQQALMLFYDLFI